MNYDDDKDKPKDIKDILIEELEAKVRYLEYEIEGLRTGQQHAAKLWKQEKDRADELDEALHKIAEVILITKKGSM